MSAFESLFAKDILLDDDAFQTASGGLKDLSQDLEALRRDIEGLLTDLATGFGTPAGRKFIRSCKGNLLQPMTDLAAVILHVSDNLGQAKNMYQSIFDEFADLNNSINSQF